MSVKGQTAATANVAAAAAITFAGQMLPCNATGLTHTFFFFNTHTLYLLGSQRSTHKHTSVVILRIYCVPFTANTRTKCSDGI